MSVKIKSGVGTGSRTAVFDHRMRELEVQQSLTNHISTQILNGRTGVFTVSNFIKFINSPSPLQSLLSIVNNDPINLLIIDRIYVQIPTSNITLPTSNVAIGLTNTQAQSINNLSLLNENRFKNISTGRGISDSYAVPNVTIDQGGGPAFIIYNKIYPTLGDNVDLIYPGTDAIMLKGQVSPGITKAGNNVISVNIDVTGTFTALVYVFIRFMMVPPDQLG